MGPGEQEAPTKSNPKDKAVVLTQVQEEVLGSGQL